MTSLMTVSQVASLLGVHPKSIYEMSGLPQVKIGRRVRYRPADVDHYIQKSRQVPFISPAERVIIVAGDVEMKHKGTPWYNLGYGGVLVRRTKAGHKRYYLVYHDGTRRVQRVAKHATCVEDAIAELQRAVGTGPGKRRVGFSVFADIYFETYSKTTKKSWKDDEWEIRNLKEFLKDTDMRDITPLQIERFRASRLTAGNSKATVNRHLQLMKHMFTVAIEEGHAETNPVKKAKLYSEREFVKERILSPDEERKLLAVSPPHLRDIIVFALYTGMRKGEILGLRWETVNLKEGLIRVEYAKSGRHRIVPLAAPARAVLESLSYRKGVVFRYKEQGIKDVKRSFKTACREADITGLRFHDLRHTFATRLAQAGVDVATMSKVLGHHSLIMTQRYVHPGLNGMKRAVEVFDADLLNICLTEFNGEKSVAVPIDESSMDKVN